MKPIQHLRACLTLFMVSVSAQAQFTLRLSPVSTGTGELRFPRDPGYYYSLESSANLTSGFVRTSGWMFGDAAVATCSINFPANTSSNGGTPTVVASDTFSLYPFDNGKTLVSWSDAAEVRYNVIINQDYSGLPPSVVVPESQTATSAMLLIGRVAWSPAFDALSPSLLPANQQAVFARLPTLTEAMAAATSGGTSGPAVIVTDARQFFRNSSALAAWRRTRMETGSIGPWKPLF